MERKESKFFNLGKIHSKFVVQEILKYTDHSNDIFTMLHNLNSLSRKFMKDNKL